MKSLFENISAAFHSGNFIAIFSIVVISVIVIPFISIIAIKPLRLWFKQGIEGDNQRLDLHEITQIAALFTNFICLLLYAYMIISHGINGTTWSLEDKLLTAGIAAGADATLIASIVMRYKGKSNV